MKPTIVDHYGVHQASNGLTYLIQDDEQNSRGLNVKSNLKVRTHRRLPVTHNLRLSDSPLLESDSSILRALEKDKLGRLFLPTPTNQGRVVFLSENDLDFQTIARATWLSNPTPRLPTTAAWRLTPAVMAGQSRLTNIQPFVVTAVTPRWMRDNGSQALDLYRMGTRPLILTGSDDVVLPPEIERVTDKAIRKLHKMETSLPIAGGIYLRNWMRNQ